MYKPQNPPQKHHYIPEFYLKRWAGIDNKVSQFTKPYQDKVATSRKHPAQTGYLIRGYELKGHDAESAQQIEANFFSPVDALASQALQKLEKYGTAAKWETRLRSAWSRFLLSLLLRCPEDISELREHWKERTLTVSDASQERYTKARGKNEPLTLAEFISNQSENEFEASFHRAILPLIDNHKIGPVINDMTWKVIDILEKHHELLTSDRPIVRTHGITMKGGHIALPIGPRKLFVASADETFFEELQSQSQQDLIKACNTKVVQSAVKYVYGSNDAQFRFIKNRFGRNPEPRLATLLRGKISRTET